MKLRKLSASDVTFTIECLPEDIPIEGNAMASGDDEFDRGVARDIQRALDRGNQWAWCCVKVTATYHAPNGQTFRGSDYLGGCSYESEADFVRCNDYIVDMKKMALDDLNESIERIAGEIPEETEA